MTANLRPFMVRVMAGEIDNPESVILDEIDTWHAIAKDTITLAYYLGMSDEEYKAWVDSRASVWQLVERRHAPSGVE